MHHKITKESMRVAPLALALVLFAVLGLMALRTQAYEQRGATTSTFQKNVQHDPEERRELVSEQVQEQKKLYTEVREESSEMRMEQRAALHAAFQEKRDELMRQLQESRESRKEKAEEYKARFSAQVQSRLGGYVERMVERMTKITEQLEQIAQRIESRIEKIEATGVDLTDASVQLEAVYQTITDAEKNVSLLGEMSVEVITSEDPRAHKDAIRDAAMLAKESIQAVHKSLSETVQEIKSSTEIADVSSTQSEEDTQ